MASDERAKQIQDFYLGVVAQRYCELLNARSDCDLAVLVDQADSEALKLTEYVFGSNTQAAIDALES